MRLSRVRDTLSRHDPVEIRIGDEVRAAVAMILRRRRTTTSGEEAEVLLIERARREGDPWSGQMAFPGGRREPGDADLWHTAERETCEEVGIDLAGAERLGRLDDLRGRPGRRPFGIVISAFVYHLDEAPEPRPNVEVESAFWVPLAAFQDPQRRVRYQMPELAGDATFPGIVVGDPDRHVVWGLTLRFVEAFISLLDDPKA